MGTLYRNRLAVDMSTRSLKKLVLRKEAALVTEILQAMDDSLCIHSDQGDYLLGNRQTFEAIETFRKAAITLEGETIGWISGSASTEAAAKLLSNMAYRNLEKRKITQELLDKYKEITLLFSLSEQITETLDIDKLAQLVLDKAIQFLPSDGGSLMLLHETTNTLESIANFGQSLHYDQTYQQTLSVGKGLIGQVAATGKGEIVNHVQADERFLPGEVGIDAIDSSALICAPLKVKNRLIGVIVLYRLAHQPYRAEEFKLLTTLGSHVASVVSFLSNEKQLKESRQNDIVFQLSCFIRNSLDLPDTLQTAVQRIRAALWLDRCFFLWHRAEGEIILSSEQSQQRLSREHFAIVNEAKSPTLSSLIGTYDIEAIDRQLLVPLYQQEIVKIDDIDQLEASAFIHFLRQKRCKSLLAFPMMTRTGQTGLLCCSSSRPRRWEKEEVDLLRAVSSQLIIAIDQAELYAHSLKAGRMAEEKAQALEQTLDELRRLQMQLVQNEKMSGLGQMVAGISHEINNPIGFIYGNLSHLENNVKDLLRLTALYQQEIDSPSQAIQDVVEDVNLTFLTQDLPKLVESMKIGTKRVHEIVLALRTFAQLDQAEFNQVDLHKCIDSALLLSQHRLQAQAITLGKNYGDLPLVHCYARQINQVFTYLLNNAIDALETVPEAARSLTISTQIEEEQAVIKVADSGPGIPSNIRHRIFDPFFTTKAVGQGKGIGLAISYQIVTQRHQGRLECRTEVGKGCEFVIAIPVRPTHDHNSQGSTHKSFNAKRPSTHALARDL